MKIGDFGFCKQLKTKDELTKTMLGSPLYMAPEILLGKDYNSKTDIWSLGVILYEMLYGECPFNGKTVSAIVNLVEQYNLDFPAHYSVSKKTIDLIKKMLMKDPAKRISWEDLIQDVLNEKAITSTANEKSVGATSGGDYTEFGKIDKFKQNTTNVGDKEKWAFSNPLRQEGGTKRISLSNNPLIGNKGAVPVNKYSFFLKKKNNLNLNKKHILKY